MISIVIPTIERDAHLRRCLESLLSDDAGGPFEIFVGDQSPDDRRDRILAGLDAANIRWLRVPKGKCRALNRALAAARGDLFVCLDDDVAVRAGWFRELRRIGGERPFDIVYGAVVEPRPLAPGEVLPRTELLSATAAIGPERGKRALLGMGANVAGRTAVFRTLGGFDEAFGPGSVVGAGDDVDFAIRATDARLHRRFDPALVVAHYEFQRVADGSAGALLNQYARGYGGIWMKDLRLGNWRRAASRLKGVLLASPKDAERRAAQGRAARIRHFAAGARVAARLPLDRKARLFRSPPPEGPS